jgi:hypothetical protein
LAIMKWHVLGAICLGFWLGANPARAQAPNAPPNPGKPPETASPTPSPPPAPQAPAATPEEMAHQAMVEEQERRDREAEAERDRDDL